MDGRNFFSPPFSTPFQNRTEVACRICDKIFKNNQDLINHVSCHCYIGGRGGDPPLSNFHHPRIVPVGSPVHQRSNQQPKPVKPFPKSPPLFEPHPALVMLQQFAMAQKAAAKRPLSPSLELTSPPLPELPYHESSVPVASMDMDSSRTPFPPIPILEQAKRRRLMMDRQQLETVSYLEKLEHPEIIFVTDSDSEKNDKGANVKELDLTLRI